MDLSRTQWVKLFDVLSDIAFAIALQNKEVGKINADGLTTAHMAENAVKTLAELKASIENGR